MRNPNEGMTLSPKGETFIKAAEEEGGMPRLKAYNDGTGTYTISWGCTKGVKKGQTCTVAEAQKMFDEEIAEFVSEVHRLIKVPVSQGLFDALVSFFFNNGTGKCQSLINAVNSGSDTKTRAVWMRYCNAYNQKKGCKEPWPGLVSRRTEELQHWASMDAENSGKAAEKWAPAEEADKPGHIVVASKSKSVWAQVIAVLMMVASNLGNWIASGFDGLAGFFGLIPDIKSEVDRLLDPASSLSGYLHLNVPMLAAGISILCIGVAIVRHVQLKAGSQ